MTTPHLPTYPGVATIRLPAVLPAVSLSREFIRQTLRLWQLADQIDTAELVASELVSNAIKRTSTTETTGKSEDIYEQPIKDESIIEQNVNGQQLIGVQLRAVEARLYVEVWDRGDGAPAIPEQSLDAEGGRGLFLVQSMSTRWGIAPQTVGGKVVWSELALSEPVNSSLLLDALPLTDPGSHAVAAAAELELLNLALTRRVLDGLCPAHHSNSGAVAV